MIRTRRALAATLAAVCSVAVFVSACGTSPAETTGTSADAGDPVAGGVARAIVIGEPRTLDPAGLGNSWTRQSLLGNALYGTLMIEDPSTLDMKFTMATDFSTVDGGSTFTLKLRPGLTFSDETPLDAAAVKFNWDRLRDPANPSDSIRQASQVASTEVVDATTLNVVMAAPSPVFPQALVTGAMNWIASPTALQKGQAAFDENPVGAGPFTLTRWTRQDVMELKKNPRYWDAPKPYLDGLTLRTVADATQRLNTMIAGGADFAMETNWASLAQAQDAGLSTDTVSFGGGLYMGMNVRRAPFDDERARRAVSMAVDLEAVNTVINDGKGVVPQTLFPETSPFFSDIPLTTPNKETAQKLFDELAAEGKPLSFTFTTYALPENKATAETVQAQLSAFKNVSMDIEVVDAATGNSRNATHDFDMIIASALFQDPDAALWTAFHSSSQGNITGISDQQLTGALDAGRVGKTIEERRAAYETVQKRLVALNPGIWYAKSAPSVITAKNAHGVVMYGFGSPLPEEFWMTN
ncbi:ABC transporter substrate-binding protein [Rhodococcus globerulus]|jgi:peptide/nickel transport system substrate-binding protein|uniref:Peptide/nickel transport system substrate-binding protein n=1 Tax=Nocardia globerula TaxID=1818 RepID=A0A652YL70_NOCGL|nr:ABC transporter substrate-binding protein [Rhodococcus globerulus]NMD60320.1 ABC transporter substrate-binding protein [Nocardia globerula]PVX63565.1 peptide/nickel transport system substrate-binding protein [Rhodococcus globerulus]QXW05073.1 ABC transporter substrate-binding protein [Rhodococcus globerulus]